MIGGLNRRFSSRLEFHVESDAHDGGVAGGAGVDLRVHEAVVVFVEDVAPEDGGGPVFCLVADLGIDDGEGGLAEVVLVIEVGEVGLAGEAGGGLEEEAVVELVAEAEGGGEVGREGNGVAGEVTVDRVEVAAELGVDEPGGGAEGELLQWFPDGFGFEAA